VEFYFSDSNLPKDKFLKEKIAEGEDGCELCPRRLPGRGVAPAPRCACWAPEMPQCALLSLRGRAELSSMRAVVP
jgi:hypothetical protein